MKLKMLFTIALGLAMSLNVCAENESGEPLGPEERPYPHRAPRVKPTITVDNFRNGTAIILPKRDIECLEVEFFKDGCIVRLECYTDVEEASMLMISAQNTADSFAIIVNGREVYADEF